MLVLRQGFIVFLFSWFSFCHQDGDAAKSRGSLDQQIRRTLRDVVLEWAQETAPVFENCPSQVIQQAAAIDSAKTSVSWPEIRAVDASGRSVHMSATPANVAASGGLFDEGITLVRFEAGEGVAPCVFVVQVTVIRCNDLPRFDDKRIVVEGCEERTEGSICVVKCPLAIPMVGNRYMTCRRQGFEGVWDYGQMSSPPASQPFCQVASCPPLRAPNNGAIVCENWSGGRFCQLQCQEDFDVPASHVMTRSVLLCDQNTGRWNGAVPDCEYREYGQRYHLRSSHYFSGPCASNQDDIKRNFLDAVRAEDLESTEYSIPANINVKCGDEVEDDAFDFDF